MRSKAPLALMEQVVMVLVFALAAALCLRAFVWSDQLSQQSAARDMAALQTQSAAECIKAAGQENAAPADIFAAAAAKLGGENVAEDAAQLLLLYDENWQLRGDREPAVYALWAEMLPEETPGLGLARVWVRRLGEEEPLFELETAWQTEVAR